MVAAPSRSLALDTRFSVQLDPTRSGPLPVPGLLCVEALPRASCQLGHLSAPLGLVILPTARGQPLLGSAGQGCGVTLRPGLCPSVASLSDIFPPQGPQQLGSLSFLSLSPFHMESNFLLTGLSAFRASESGSGGSKETKTDLFPRSLAWLSLHLPIPRLLLQRPPGALQRWTFETDSLL